MYLHNKEFPDKNIAIFLPVITIFTLVPRTDIHGIDSLSCTVKNFRVYLNGDVSNLSYRYRSTGGTITIIFDVSFMHE